MVTASLGKIAITAMPSDQIWPKGEEEEEGEEELGPGTNPYPNPTMKY